jgi:hypothetical protein
VIETVSVFLIILQKKGLQIIEKKGFCQGAEEDFLLFLKEKCNPNNLRHFTTFP